MKNKILIPICMLAILLFACEKYEFIKNKNGGSNQTTPSNYYIHLTDAPGDYTEVNVDIQSVVVKTNRYGDVSLNIKAGVYNLLNFQNGIDTLLAFGGFDSCVVSQIRLILGQNNTVVVDSVSYPLSIPSGEQSGLKLQVHHELNAGVSYHILLDFDAKASIIKTGQNKYKLKPVIKVIDSAYGGSIKGLLTPPGVACTITATDTGNNSFSVQADLSGQFIIKGLAPGTYDVEINPASPFALQTIPNVVVVKGKTSFLGTLSL